MAIEVVLPRLNSYNLFRITVFLQLGHSVSWPISGEDISDQILHNGHKNAYLLSTWDNQAVMIGGPIWSSSRLSMFRFCCKNNFAAFLGYKYCFLYHY